MTAKFPYPILAGEDPNTNIPVVGFVFEGMFIYDPRLSDCARFTVDPSFYGLTEEQASTLDTLNAKLKQQWVAVAELAELFAQQLNERK